MEKDVYLPPSVAVIGGGPAGMSAAIAAQRAGARVVLYEKNDRVGKKLLATGNGRCNISNADMSLRHYHGGNAAWIEKAFSKVTPDDVEAFWRELGIEIVTLEEGKKYPMSLQASSALDALRFAMERQGVRTVCGQEILHIQRRKGKYELLFRGTQSKEYFDRVIVTVGGKASPQLGADGCGADLARELGLKSSPLRPSIVRLKARSEYLKALAGCKVNAKAALTDKNDPQQILQSEYGEVLFTAEGLSGPPILQLARRATDPAVNGRIHLDLFPEMNSGELFRFLLERAERLSFMSMQEMLGGILPRRVIIPVLKSVHLNLTAGCSELSRKQIAALAAFLQNWVFDELQPAGWQEAQVTCGGILLGQIDPQTMEAQNVPGCYFAGEVLDVDGDCGGYNLQWAVCSGLLAGQAAGNAETKKFE